MSIQGFFDQDITVTRLSSVSGEKIAYSEVATVRGHIQELDAEARQALGIIEERAWQAWLGVDTDVVEQDRLTDEAGTVYVVREITKKDYKFGINTHLNVLLEEQNE